MGATTTYRKRDLETAIAVAKAAGLTVIGTEIDRNGTIKLFYGDPAALTSMGLTPPRPKGVVNLRDVIDGKKTTRAS